MDDARVVARFERLLKVTVLEINNTSVRLGFEIDSSVPVHRWEMWQQIHGAEEPQRFLADPLAPVV